MGQAEGPTRAERTRARLLEAAVQTFSERGFHGTTTRDIATASGLSSAALYVHHKSKEELLFEISKAGHEETLEIVTAAVASTDQVVEQFRALVRGYVLFHVRKHTMARVINYEMAALSPDHLAEIKQIRRRIDRVIYGLVRAGVTAGVFDTPDSRMTAVVLESMGIDIARWYCDHGNWTPAQIANRYVDMALRLVGFRP
ncbi:TetR family transcriptional regulator [Dactylosporangium sp. CA-233914]|uniref:TetR family transcriptional regulator n=1 Tax=Dactylosporangium sp. CA-233914 TaxID=3239934 RepID=UPI003D92A24C